MDERMVIKSVALLGTEGRPVVTADRNCVCLRRTSPTSSTRQIVTYRRSPTEARRRLGLLISRKIAMGSMEVRRPICNSLATSIVISAHRRIGRFVSGVGTAGTSFLSRLASNVRLRALSTTSRQGLSRTRGLLGRTKFLVSRR